MHHTRRIPGEHLMHIPTSLAERPPPGPRMTSSLPDADRRPLRHFAFLSDSDRQRLFHRVPQSFHADDPTKTLAIALGATLYSPAIRPTLGADIAKLAAQGVMSSVVCLEDAVCDSDLVSAERNAIEQLCALADSGAPRPLIFSRVRSPEQIPRLVRGLGEHAAVLSGFVLPKFSPTTGPAFLSAVDAASAAAGIRLLVMPVIESSEFTYAEDRVHQLLEVRALLHERRDSVVAVRIGATDLSAIYGLRRSRELTVYDVRILADVISDVVNVLGRTDGTGYAVTGPVWEYFPGAERLFKPQLRESPFIEHSERSLRAGLLAKDLDGLIREIALDKANGLIGKTVIHPTHVAAVHALSVVTHEEYSDALDVLDTKGHGGVAASSYGNKMNESKPHFAWAQRIMDRAEMFGVARATTSFVDLLGAGLNQ
jgi:citrate lyase beta subunit